MDLNGCTQHFQHTTRNVDYVTLIEAPDFSNSSEPVLRDSLQSDCRGNRTIIGRELTHTTD